MEWGFLEEGCDLSSYHLLSLFFLTQSDVRFHQLWLPAHLLSVVAGAWVSFMLSNCPACPQALS